MDLQAIDPGWRDVMREQTGDIAIAHDATLQKQAKDALRESEELLREAQIIAGLGTYCLDIITGTWSSSDILDSIFGIDESFDRSVSGWMSLLHPEDQEMMQQYFTDEVLGKHRRFDREYRIIRKDNGRKLWVHGIGRLEFNEQDQPGRMIGTIQDITGRKQTEEILRASEERFRLLFEKSNDAIFITIPDGSIISANPEACRMFGRTEEEFYQGGRSMIIDPSDDRFGAAFESRARTGDFNGELNFIRKNGEVFPADVSSSIFNDSSGNTRSTVRIRDISERKRLEQKLHDSEERYRMLFNEAHIGICLADVETGIITDCNQAMANLTERPIGDLIGSHQTILHPPQESNLPFSATFIQHMKEASGDVLPDQIITSSGEIRDVEIKARTINFRDRLVMLGAFNDITERKQAEKALRESTEHYQALYRLIRLMCDNVPDLIWAKDLDQRYIFANKAMCEILLNAEDTVEPVGRNDVYFAERERAAHPDQPDWHTFGELCMDTDTVVMATRIANRFDESGNVKGKHLFLDVSKAPFWDEQGQMIGTVGCGRDVTRVKQLEEERRLAEELLQGSEERLRRAEEMGHLGHWSLDLKTNIQSWSDEMYRIYGVTADEFQPTYERVFQLVHPDDRESRIKAYTTIRKEGKGSIGYRIVRPDGQQRIISGSGEILYDTNGEPETIFGIILDITELHRKESELHQKNAEMERFTYTVSHDLRSPLVTIKTFLGYLEQDIAAGNPGRINQDIAYIHGAADKMRCLLDDLIEMSRVGRIVNDHTPFSFRELLEGTLVIVAGQIAALDVDVRVQAVELAFFGDRARLTEVWQNLLDNAVKYMGDQPAPCIQIGVEGRGRDSVFFVRDNGIGITQEHGEKIFGLFEKLDNQSEGTGLGLTLVKRIVEMNGGRIWVESEGIGQGSCFRFTLPEVVIGEGGSRP
jgi:PAS domain S-box-containing protein